ncbi:hypothetical protein [Nesterenkonia massiliensis]|uniref:hypothetical protein n=1 Tax=Nesterenkonia massiliensis TaxID=1232429 RepID=UPI0004045FC9|nr:hypothetical protein [Nesterenkonia massiliensis]
MRSAITAAMETVITGGRLDLPTGLWVTDSGEQRTDLSLDIIDAAQRGLRTGDQLVAMGLPDLARLLWQEDDAENPRSWEIHSRHYNDRASTIIEALNLPYRPYQRPSVEDQVLLDAWDMYSDTREERVIDQVIPRVQDKKYLSVLDIASLVSWPRLSQQNQAIEKLYEMPEERVEDVTARAYQAVTGRDGKLVDKAHTGWQILCELPGFDQNLGLASAVLHVCSPLRMPVWDKYVERGLDLLNLPITTAAGPYAQYVQACIKLERRISQNSALSAYYKEDDPLPTIADRALHVIGRRSFTPPILPRPGQ